MSAIFEVAVSVLDEGWSATLRDAAALGRRAALAALEAAGEGAKGEVAIVLGDDALLRQLNRDHRGQDRPTNVLAFPLSEPGGAPALPALLGDVVIARETTLREAAEQGKSAADHLTHLVVHGTLHLLGHDHETDAEARRMETLEVAVLARLGIADPYSAPDAPAQGAA